MIEKEFIPYEQALALKALGFDEPCFGYYVIDDKQLIIEKWMQHPNQSTWTINAPTFSQAINFLYICSNKQIDIELKASDTYEERFRKVDQGCEDLWNLQNSKSN